MEARRADSERIDALEDLERQRHEEAERARVKAKQASLLMAVTPKPGPGAMSFSGSSSKDSGIGSQSSYSQFVRGPHAADSDIPPDACRDGVSAHQCGVSYQILDPLIKQEKCEHVKNIGTLKQNIVLKQNDVAATLNSFKNRLPL